MPITDPDDDGWITVDPDEEDGVRAPPRLPEGEVEEDPVVRRVDNALEQRLSHSRAS